MTLRRHPRRRCPCGAAAGWRRNPRTWQAGAPGGIARPTARRSTSRSISRLLTYENRAGRADRRHRHHRAQARRGARRLHGASRRADVAAQPRAAALAHGGDARPHAPRRPRRGDALRRPRQLQDRQRHARPSVRRPAAAGSGRAPARRVARATTPWRGSAATNSPSCRRTSVEPEDAGALAQRLLAVDRRAVSISTAITSPSAPASASRWRPATATMPTGCSRAPTWRSTAPRPTARARSASSRPRWMRACRRAAGSRSTCAPRCRAGELEVHYQPLIDLAIRRRVRLRGAAALAASRSAA